MTALSTHQGKLKAATTVVVTGANFTGTTAVTVAGTKAKFKIISSTRLTITVPARQGDRSRHRDQRRRHQRHGRRKHTLHLGLISLPLRRPGRLRIGRSQKPALLSARG
ncbi:IPT/TIG domain-containing protein [Actinoplanes sp. NPDC051859]|uniref:IPT/TIG domain-containing protein n=1 Tax=Actinoplanes sp. NPDC051859 TaxID=3363909 RepID=UPI00378B9A0C